VHKEEEVRAKDEEDREDVDQPDARLDEKHPVKAGEGRCRDRKQAIRPEAAREQVHHRDAQRPEEGGRDSPTEGVEPKVDVVAARALELCRMTAVPYVPARA